MNRPDYSLGTIVLSLMGRDSDRYYIIVGVCQGDFVLIADGDLRRVSDPKKKRLKHLKATPMRAEGIAEKLSQNKPVSDSEVRAALAAAMR